MSTILWGFWWFYFDYINLVYQNSNGGSKNRGGKKIGKRVCGSSTCEDSWEDRAL